MDLFSLRSLSDILLNRPQFQVETINLAGANMYQDLRMRISAQGQAGPPWNFALLIGKQNDNPGLLTGLILLEELANDHYAGIYYPHANCGSHDEATLTTIYMILLLDFWPNAEALANTLTTFGNKFCISQLGKDMVTRLGHHGPSIDPI